MRNKEKTLRSKPSAISRFITDFLEYCEIEKNRSQLTIRNYDHYLRRFSEFACKKGVNSPGGITLDLIREYRLFLNRYKDEEGNNLKKITQNYHIIALRAFLRYLAKRDIKSLAAERVELGKIERKEVTFLESDELDRLLASVDPQVASKKKKFIVLRDRAILETLFSTGLRVSELINLDRNQINLTRGEFMVRGKGGKERIVFLSDTARHWLVEYLKNRQDNFKALFISKRDAQGKKSKERELRGEEPRLTPRSVERIIKKYALAAGLVKDVTPHVMRHTYATDLLISGADIRSVQQMLGHANITTTQIYTHITDQQLRDVHKAFHGRRRRK
jgi:site-specific recombinase XerD